MSQRLLNSPLILAGITSEKFVYLVNTICEDNAADIAEQIISKLSCTVFLRSSTVLGSEQLTSITAADSVSRCHSKKGHVPGRGSPTASVQGRLTR